MPALSPTALRKQIRAGTLDPVYLLLGADEAEKAALVGAMAGLIDEELRAFNVERFYGGESSAGGGSIVDAARTLPLAAPKRIIVVLQAEHLLAPKRETQAVERDQDLLASYLKAPAAHACVAFVAGSLDERRTLPRLLLKTASVVRCEGLADPTEAARWLRETAETRGLAIEPKAVQLLVGGAAGDTARLRADAERLLLYAAGRASVTIADVETITSEVHVASGDWAVTNAIERGEGAEALRELAAQLGGGASPHMILGQLAWCVRTRLDRRRVPGAIDAVFRTDLALKSSGGDPRVLLERLVVELCG